MKYSLLFDLETFYFFPVAFFCVYTCEDTNSAPSGVNSFKCNLKVTEKLMSEHRGKLNLG